MENVSYHIKYKLPSFKYFRYQHRTYYKLFKMQIKQNPSSKNYYHRWIKVSIFSILIK